MSRYQVPGGSESEFEPDSNGLVLRNKLRIVHPEEMAQAETRAYQSMALATFETLTTDQPITASYICELHKIWLGEIYDFAGEYRSVNLSKDGLLFCHAEFIPEQMTKLDEGPLKEHTPCEGFSRARLLRALSVVHADLILIHPFREGNGRIARWIASIMSMQAGFPQPIFEESDRDEYFAALRKGFTGVYEPLERCFDLTLSRS